MSAVGTITLLAGTAIPGYSGDGGPASQADTCFPAGIAAGVPLSNNTAYAAAYVYIADSCNNRIRMITMSLGIITTVAGTGAAAYGGDKGLALNATLNGPSSVAFDSKYSNIYIADTYNNRIRMINTKTNIITTVAGTGSYGYSGRGDLATLAMLNNPLGVAWDSFSSRLYIADSNNHRIRVIDGSTAIITSVAGTGVAGYSGDSLQADKAALSYPAKITTDSSGNLYIADTGNHRIRMVIKNTGIITTLAGAGAAGYSGDGMKAVRALLFKPSDVSLDLLGNVYIADTINNRIRKVDMISGIITTVAGTGTAGYSGDGGPATGALLSQPLSIDIDGAGTVYIADTSNSRVRTILALGTPSPAPITPLAVFTLEINQVRLLNAAAAINGAVKTILNMS